MFAPLKDRFSRPQARNLATSLLLHGLFLAWLVHIPDARVLAPSSVAAGTYGTSLTHLFWPSLAMGKSAESSARHTITWNKSHQRKLAKAKALAMADESKAATSNPPAPAGQPYGTLASGPAFGDEIRPALPISAVDPVVDPHDLAGRGEGSVVVEVTIDDHGNIVQKVVLQSLGPFIDNKVLAALESWRFRPATRNGIAIPSKQDVYYHFKPNG